MPSSLLTVLILLGIAVTGGSAPPVTKILFRSFSPFPLAFIRFFIASAILLPLFLKLKRPRITTTLREVLPITILSSLNIVFFYLGLQTTTANASSIIYAGTPILVAVLAKFLLDESLDLRKIIGILLGFVGVVTIVILPMFETGQNVTGEFQGNILVFIATITWALYTIGSRYLTSKRGYEPLAVTSVSLFTSAVIFFVLGNFIFPGNYIRPLSSQTTLLLVIYLAVGPTIGAIFLYQWAIKHLSATTASLVLYLQPVVGILLGIIFLGEKITLGFIVGSVLVLLGVGLATGKELSQKIRRKH